MEWLNTGILLALLLIVVFVVAPLLYGLSQNAQTVARILRERKAAEDKQKADDFFTSALATVEELKQEYARGETREDAEAAARRELNEEAPPTGWRESTVASIAVPLTAKESDALSELSKADDLTPERVMIQALRLYQLVKAGGATMTFPDDAKGAMREVNSLLLFPPATAEPSAESVRTVYRMIQAGQIEDDCVRTLIKQLVTVAYRRGIPIRDLLT